MFKVKSIISMVLVLASVILMGTVCFAHTPPEMEKAEAASYNQEIEAAAMHAQVEASGERIEWYEDPPDWYVDCKANGHSTSEERWFSLGTNGTFNMTYKCKTCDKTEIVYKAGRIYYD